MAPGGKPFAYLQLIRFPNLFTAMADPLAGYLMAFGPTGGRLLEAVGLMAASAFIYAGGCALNDLCDREIDSRERPSRPIPSGRVGTIEALALICFLFGAALLVAWAVAPGALLVASILTLLVISYDAVTKSGAILGPVNMAACRAINLLLGMTPALPPVLLAVAPPLLSFAYVCAITTLSRDEVVEGTTSRNWTPLWTWGLTAAGIVAMIAGRVLTWEAILFFIPFFCVTGRALRKAVLGRTSGHIRQAVGLMVLCIPLLDGVYASGVKGWVVGIAVSAWALPAVLFSRRFYVT